MILLVFLGDDILTLFYFLVININIQEKLHSKYKWAIRRIKSNIHSVTYHMRSWQVLLLLLLFRVLSISSINNNKNNIEIMIKGNIWLHIFCERVSAQKGSMEIMSFIFHYYFTNKDVWHTADVHITLVITLPRQYLNESEDRFLFISTNQNWLEIT